MTSLTLLLWIVLSVLVQLLIALLWAYRRSEHSGATIVALPTAGTVTARASARASIAGWSGFRRLRVLRKVYEDRAQTVCSFYLAAEDGGALPDFLPGQYLTFQIPLPNSSSEAQTLTRCYSLSDVPGRECYRVSIKRIPGGRGSNAFHDHVAEGDTVLARAPSGHFHIDTGRDPVVLIGSGIGITPMLSIVQWLLATQPEREVWLFYGVRDGSELVQGPMLMALAQAHKKFQLRLCFSQPQEGDCSDALRHCIGRVSVDLLRLQLPLKPFHYYLCGPGAMMESLVPALETWGVAEDHLHFETFGPSTLTRTVSTAPAAAPMADGSQIVFARSGKTLTWSAQAINVLTLAERAGLALASGCRSGSCGTCQTRLLEGEVDYPHPPDFDPEPGHCLPCVCRPRSDIRLDA